MEMVQVSREIPRESHKHTVVEEALETEAGRAFRANEGRRYRAGSITTVIRRAVVAVLRERFSAGDTGAWGKLLPGSCHSKGSGVRASKAKDDGPFSEESRVDWRYRLHRREKERKKQWFQREGKLFPRGWKETKVWFLWWKGRALTTPLADDPMQP